jgi:hypothetical protein
MTTLALFGAGGSMGMRVVRALKDDPNYRLCCVEPGEAGKARLRDAGLVTGSTDDAVKHAGVVILAVPDLFMGKIAAKVVPMLNPGTLVITLDPAGAHAGKLPCREDISYFVTHPSHPPVFNDEMDVEARRDFFGSGKAKQAIVCALMQGPETDYARGEALACRIFGPILRSHRVTVEQMAILEPALSETLSATCLTVIREGLDEAIRLGVPPQAARDFLMGHINIELAILFNEIDWQFSAGAKKAIEEAKMAIFRPDWKRVFEAESIRESVLLITGGKAVKA